MTILVDIDNTINNLSKVVLEVNNDFYETDYSYNEIESYDWLNETFCNPWLETEHSYFWYRVKINPRAVEMIEKWVKAGHKVYLVTASYFNEALANKICRTLLPFNPALINERNVVIAQDKTAIHGDIMVDDCVDNLNSHTAFPICFAQPWNKDWKEDRTNNWEEIDKIVSNVAYHKKFF